MQIIEEEVPTTINCHFASFSPRFRVVIETVTISPSACLLAFTREICYGPFDGNSAWSTFLASPLSEDGAEASSPSGVGVCDRVAVNKELEG